MTSIPPDIAASFPRILLEVKESARKGYWTHATWANGPIQNPACGLVVVAKKTAYHERPSREDALPAAAPTWQPLRAGTSGGTQDGTCRRTAKTKRVTQLGGLYRCSQLTLSGCQLAPDVASVIRSECGPFEVARFVNPCHQPMWTGLFRWLSGHSAHPCRALNARSFRQSSPRVADRGASIPDCGPGSIVPA